MWLRRPSTELHWEVRAPPAEVERRLRRVVAEVRSFLLSPTWGRSEELVGRIALPAFQLRVRHGYSNGLTRLLYGSVTPTHSGSRIDGEFRTLLWVVLVLRGVWLLLLSGIALYLREARHLPFASGLAALAGPLLTGLLLVGIETIARRMGDADEETMRSRLGELFADIAVGGGESR
jgi:hypothetical protein